MERQKGGKTEKGGKDRKRWKDREVEKRERWKDREVEKRERGGKDREVEKRERGGKTERWRDFVVAPCPLWMKWIKKNNRVLYLTYHNDCSDRHQCTVNHVYNKVLGTSKLTS